MTPIDALHAFTGEVCKAEVPAGATAEECFSAIRGRLHWIEQAWLDCHTRAIQAETELDTIMRGSGVFAGRHALVEHPGDALAGAADRKEQG